jgi:putative membrane protein
MYLSLGTATLMAITIPAASAKDKPSDAFLKKAIEGNFAEVSMGDLAQKNGQSDGVKSFGKMLSTDHAAANQKAMDAAKGDGHESALRTRSRRLSTTKCQKCPVQVSTRLSQHI